MKKLITLLSVAALSACITAPQGLSREDLLAYLTEFRTMPCDQLELRRNEHMALREFQIMDIAANESQRRKCK